MRSDDQRLMSALEALEVKTREVRFSLTTPVDAQAMERYLEQLFRTWETVKAAIPAFLANRRRSVVSLSR